MIAENRILLGIQRTSMTRWALYQTENDEQMKYIESLSTNQNEDKAPSRRNIHNTRGFKR